jgi:cytochrome c-type biogenesis protein CcmH/NrfG
MEFGLALIVLIGIVAMVVMVPLMREQKREAEEDHRRAALEAAKEAKYREIRDAELDYRMGKLAEEDWRASDRELRAQAMDILRELDQLDALESAERG